MPDDFLPLRSQEGGFALKSIYSVALPTASRQAPNEQAGETNQSLNQSLTPSLNDSVNRSLHPSIHPSFLNYICNNESIAKFFKFFII
uniref:Uncharacterized protein n=1 Tax=Picea glauca TaxID=3330 RepID=A0A124GN24_PICGL|nr:hypothetical protein ABT39_MTgene5669 [Picea glauca]